MSKIIEPNTKFTPVVNVSLEPQIDWSHSSVILGRGRESVKELGLKGTMQLGVVTEKQSAGASLFGYKVFFDNNFPHIIFICGKRGSGKSYTLGVIVEELGRNKTGVGTIVIDPLGTFWSMKNKNKSKKAEKVLEKYGLSPKDFKNIRVLTPIGFYEDLKTSVDAPFSIAISDLSAEDWCLVFDINRFKTQGLLIGDVLDKVNNGYFAKMGNLTKKVPPKNIGYTIGDIIYCITHDININSVSEGYAVATKRSVIARFKAAAKWGIFSVKGTPMREVSVKNKITILDVSHSKLGSSRRALIVGILSRKILEARIEASRMEEVSEMGLKVKSKKLIPVTWLIIDEAHLLLPRSGKTAASESLIEYAKLGRKPGCGLVFATQRPSATNDNILSQVDTIIGHNLALEDDIAALRRRIPAKIPKEFNNSDFIRSMPVGICLFADQKTQKRTMLVQIRPRLTHHSGKAAVPKPDEEIGSEETREMFEDDAMEEHQFEESEIIGIDLNESKNRAITFSIDDIMKLSMDLIENKQDGSEQITSKIDPDFEIDDLNEKNIIIDGTEADKNKINALNNEVDISKLSKLEVSIEKYNINLGGAYLIFSKKPEFGLEIFGNFSKLSSAQSLSITRTHPNKLDFSLIPKNTEQFWLSKSHDDLSISPGNISQIAHIINEFLKSNQTSTVLLDGLEYLINHNDFPKIMKFIESIHEMVVLNNGVLFVPINPATLPNNNLELLENELTNTIIDPESGLIKPGEIFTKLDRINLDQKQKNLVEKESGTGKLVADSISDKELPNKSEKGLQTKSQKLDESDDLQSPGVRSATKKELQTICKKLGLSTTGSVETLKRRLLDFDETKTDVQTGIESGVDLDGRSQKLQELDVITEAEREVLKSLTVEREELDSLKAERKKLKEELNKLREAERKQKIMLERQKLVEERKKIKLEKEKIEETRKKLEQRLKESEKLAKSRGVDHSDRHRESENEIDIEYPSHDIEIEPPNKRQKKDRLEPRKKQKKKIQPKQISKPIQKSIQKPKRKAGLTRQPKSRLRSEKILENARLIVKPILKGERLNEFAIKLLKTSLLGKPQEVIENITPIFLPLLRIHVKAMRGSVFAKEHEGVFYWDTVTGEIIIDFGTGLKRSKGMATLLSLTPNQAKVLFVLETWGSNDIVEIQKGVNIPASEVKRSLTKLNKISLVSKEYISEKRIDHYKRIVELKIPKKMDKIKVDMPRIISAETNDNIINSQFKLNDLEKIIKTIIPGTRIINKEDVFYPYYRVDIIGKSGPRSVLLDAVTGNNDKILTKFINFQN